MTGSADAFAGTPETWRFDGFVIVPAAFRLEKDGAQLRIEPKAFEVLLYLIRNRNRVVTKQELLDSVWAGTVVTENALTRAIAQIRKVLGDELKAPRFIETIPTRGYRFIAGLENPPAPSPPPLAAPSHTSFRPGRLIAIAILVAGLLIGLSLVRPRIVSTRGPKIQPPWAQSAKTHRPLAASRLTRPGGVYLFPAFSPDPASISYTGTQNGALAIFKSRLDGAQAVPVTSGSGEIQAAWSPDGLSLAFSRPGGGIWIQPAGGGASRQVSTFGSRPAWSPDSRQILFQSAEQVEMASTIHEPMPPSRIWIVNADGRSARPVTRAGGSQTSPNWRRDGQRIVFITCYPDDCALQTVARDGSDLKTVTRTNFRISSAVFHPSQPKIFYLHNKYAQSDLMSVAVSEDGAAAGDPALLRRTPWTMKQHLAISADGSRLAWSTIEQTSNLISVDTKSGNLTPLTNHTAVRATFPSLSPDGKKIAYVALIGENDSGVWVSDADGLNGRPLTAGRNLNQRLQWSSNGMEVTYAAWADGPVVRATSLVNEKSFVIAHLPRDAKQPALSPDRRMIAFDRIVDGESTVWIAEENNTRRITPLGQQASLAVWSPSGRQIAVQVRDADGKSQIAVVTPQGGDPRVVTSGMEESSPHSWSPDEKFIAFAGRRGGVWNVWAARADGGTPVRITQYTDPTISVRSPAWSAGGNTIVFEYAEPDSAIWVSHPLK